MDAALVRAQRLAAHGLRGRRSASVVDVIRRVVAVHAQLPTAAALAIRARTAGLTVNDVDDALADGSIVKIWGLRGTLHLVAADDVGWLLALLGPQLVSAGRRRLARMGVDDDAAGHAV